MPAREELPSTVRRSADKAQRTWAKAHDSAVDSYGEGERAHRTAFSALKHRQPAQAQAQARAKS